MGRQIKPDERDIAVFRKRTSELLISALADQVMERRAAGDSRVFRALAPPLKG
jgi:hypothetical protein